MSKAVSADVSNSPARKPPIALFGCGGLVLVLCVAIAILGFRFNTFRNQPINKDAVLQSLAGVPIYPDALFDDDATREALAGPQTLGMDDPFRTLAEFRTSADPIKQVIPFYDTTLASFGFQKTRVGGGPGLLAGASYTNGPTGIVVQVKASDDGGPAILLLMRQDNGRKAILGKPKNIVTPEDFQRVLHLKAKPAK